ncbi:uncharacterized protein LOC141683378 [Apium graveolens]|uniref:uncharacterized protein LOC141683378 n=1 Tax=Apium graveolens TaxID=4045 RepID=UPI003D7B2F56
MDFRNALLKELPQVPASSSIQPENQQIKPTKVTKKNESSTSASSENQPPASRNRLMVSRRNQSSTTVSSRNRAMGARNTRRRTIRRRTSTPSGLPESSLLSTRFKGLYSLMGYTSNNSATYLSSGNPCLDFFFHVVPNTPPSQLVKRLESSWNHDPLTTLKLICNLRGVRGTGKTDKEGFYTAALWLHKHHPQTLASNVHIYATFGYFKDLLEILFRIIQGPDARSQLKREWQTKLYSARGRRRSLRWLDLDYLWMPPKEKNDMQEKEMIRKRWRAQLPREVRIKRNEAKMMREKENARFLRRKKQMARAKKVQELYRTDMNYRFLHDQIATFFADLLKADMELLNSGKATDISLAGKWCPTIDSSYDKYTLICATIARKVFPRELYPEYEGLVDAQYVSRVRDRLRKQVLVPLHRALRLPEVYMSAKKWRYLPYNRVASVAMTNYTDIFMDRDKVRFNKYIEKVKEGKAKIASGALLPHDILKSCLGGTEGQKTVAELQWNGMVENMLKKGKLTNCIAVSDVSGSMSGTPMEVSVALGLLVSELSEEPWKGHVITFSANPQLHLIKGSSLPEKSTFIRKMAWGMNTNFQKVFDKILEVAVNAKLREDQMIKTVFVFSDMEFDKASNNPWETDYMVIQKKFKKNGYERVPNIVFWNLRNSSATPVKATENGVAMLSGYSKNLLTLFLRGGGEINPELVLEAVIAGDEYQNLVVYD